MSRWVMLFVFIFFSSIGEARTNGKIHNAWARSAIQLQNGKTFVIGDLLTDNAGLTSYLIMAMYNPNGSLDAHFGNNGTLIEEPCDLHYAGETKELGNGQILVTWSCFPDDVRGTRSGVLKINSDGSKDPSFGVGGVAYVDQMESVSTTHILSDGKLFLSGRFHNPIQIQTPKWVRLNANGSLDTTFGNGGELVISLPGLLNGIGSTVLLPDGKILLVGIQQEADRIAGTPAIWRFYPDGTLDPSFGVEGVVLHDVSPESFTGFSDVVVLENGKILALGETDLRGGELLLVRMNPDGSDDLTFGNSGIVRMGVLEDDWEGGNINIRKNEKGETTYLITGLTWKNASHALLSFHENGTLDTEFGVNGVANFSLGGDSVRGGFRSLLAQTEDSILVYGGREIHVPGVGYPLATALIRYRANGTVDTSFGGSGVVTMFLPQESH